MNLILAAATAWVLWYQGNGPEWYPAAGYPSYEICVKFRDGIQKNNDKSVKEKNARSLFYECFPDTVDPREPKQKKAE